MARVVETTDGQLLKVWTKDPYAAQKRYIKKRVATDESFHEYMKQAQRVSKQKKYATDEEFRKQRIEYAKKYRERRKMQQIEEKQTSLLKKLSENGQTGK